VNRMRRFTRPEKDSRPLRAPPEGGTRKRSGHILFIARSV
jgi:hypothetical protein